MASFYSNTSIEIKKFIRASVSWNIIKAFFCEKTRNFIRVSKSIINLSWWSSFIFKAWAEKCRVPFPKYKKDFLLRKYGDFFFLILEIESSVSGNINKLRTFLIFGLESSVSENIYALYTFESEIAQWKND